MANHNQFWCDRAHFEYTLETLKKNKLGFDYTQIKEAIDAKWDTNGQIWLRNKANQLVQEFRDNVLKEGGHFMPLTGTYSYQLKKMQM